MVAFLCLFFPPVIAVVLTTKMSKENLCCHQYISYYAVYTVITNEIMFWILSFMFDQHSISAPGCFTTSFSAKYILLSSVIAVVLAYVAKSLHKFKSLSTDLIQEEETQEKND
jgi:hypothetical protein